MYTHLGSVQLKTGEQMELGVVRCPDPSWGTQLIPLLGHKSQTARRQIEGALAGLLDALETRFYVGTIGGFAATTCMIVGARGAGILSHVYTKPEHRQKGAYSALMAVQMEDTRQSGYRILTLGTPFEKPPYWIYHRFGFRSVDGVTGRMRWLATPDAEDDYLRPAPTQPRPMRWDDWGPLNVLALQPVQSDEELPRSPVFGLKEHGSLERPFEILQWELARRAATTAAVLEAKHGATVGWAIVAPDPRSFGDNLLLDFYVHPTFRADAPALLAALDPPTNRRIVAYSTAPEGYRTAALRDAGFASVAELPQWLKRGGQPVSMRILAREPGRAG